jgi:hypothetical protein
MREERCSEELMAYPLDEVYSVITNSTKFIKKRIQK